MFGLVRGVSPTTEYSYRVSVLSIPYKFPSTASGHLPQDEVSGLGWRLYNNGGNMSKPVKLIKQYGGIDGEHPKWTLDSWSKAAAGRKTRLGYWEWVGSMNRIESESSSKPSKRAMMVLRDYSDFSKFNARMIVEDTGMTEAYAYRLIRVLFRMGYLVVVDDHPGDGKTGRSYALSDSGHAILKDKKPVPVDFGSISAHNPFGIGV